MAKKLAQEHGIDIATLTASGPDGRIVREDVERAIATKSREPHPALRAGYPESREEAKAIPEIIPLTGIRKVIFDRMGQSWREAAHVTLFADADMTEIVRLRQERGTDWERRFGIKPSYSDLIHMAVAKALREEPRINCRLDGQGVRVRKEVNLAFAIDLGEGLLAAVIRDADKKSLGRQGSGGAGAGRTVGAGRHGGRDLHRVQPRRSRGGILHAHHQPAPGRDSGRREDPGEAGGAGRRHPRPVHDDPLAGLRPSAG
ncbi:MAG: 2-oxo acid dehydrogenase subunit E2 [candidate division NC10 bacterium]|nr:2-oxo acid dehydrogenase subunit E2 [candidate division NC10 bacterium]